MEAKTKIMAAVAVIVMCAAGLVGAGYAYTASTVNDNNSATTEYITLVQGGVGAYDFADEEKVYWDASDKKIRANDPYLTGPKQAYSTAQAPALENIVLNDLVTTYTLSAETTTAEIADYKVVKLGDTFTLNPTHSNATNVPDINITFTAASLTLPVGGQIWMKTTSNDTVQYFLLTSDNTFTEKERANAAWQDVADPDGINVEKDGTDAYFPVTVEMYFGYAEDSDGLLSKHVAGAAPVKKPAETVISAGTSLTFQIELSGANGVITISPDAVAITGTGTSTLVLDKPADFTEAVTWTSSNANIAQVSNAGVVTGVANGTVTITASITHDEVTYKATCTVTVSGIV